VLLLALPSLLVWLTLGALWTPSAPRTAGHPADSAVPASASAALLALALFAVAGTVRSTAQLAAIGIYATRNDVPALETAARLDPGNYRLRLRLARNARGREARCEHARAAHALLPNATAARDLSRRCG